MAVSDSLKFIRPAWTEQALQCMAQSISFQEDLQSQLDHFFNLLEEVIESNDLSWLDSILSLWASSLTQSDLEEGPSNLIQFVGQIHSLTIRISRQQLSSDLAVELIEALTPIFAYAFDKAAEFEIQARIAYVTNQLNDLQQSLEKLDLSKSDFIAVAAHELKTPLTLIEGYNAMLRENMLCNTIQPMEIMLLDGIHNGINRLRSIIDDMIDVSLIDNGLLKLNYQPTWINSLFSIIQSDLEQNLHERQQQLFIENFPGIDEMTFGDPERLLQLIKNIITNAMKYTPDHGSIHIDGRRLPGFVEITVSDSGIGIDPEDQAIIFEKFGRLGSSSLHSSGKTKFKGGGPGLGLYIAKGIIEAHGGAIWAESPGYNEETMPGTAIHLMIPVRVDAPDDGLRKLFAPLMQKKP
jgi:signal transduction histidine kinase